MSRPLTMRKPTTAEIRQLHTILEDGLNPWQRRRAEALLLYATGMTAVEIAQALGVHANTIYADLHAFAQHGVVAVHQLGAPGAPLRLSEAQREEILRIAAQPPYESGLPYGRWSAAKLRTYLLKQRVVKALSREHLRRVLKKGGRTFRRIRRKVLSPDPRRLAILSRLRLMWRHLPRNGRLLFFDVKPVFVKAYGGRRYTSATQLVLARGQKTRGRFYLFLAYDVGSGRSRWAYLPGKDSARVGRFMCQVRRWYPDQEVWVALDQDRAHPCKSRQT